MADDELTRSEIISYTSDIVTAYVSKNPVSATELPELIRAVHEEMTSLSAAEPLKKAVEPAVPISKSVTDNYIVCLEDGAKLKMLKRYLRSRFDLSPEEYRMRWGLPETYPMTAPEYARRRSTLAKQSGLGRPKGV